MKIAVRRRHFLLAASVGASLLAASGCNPDKGVEAKPVRADGTATAATTGPVIQYVTKEKIVYVDRPVPAGPTSQPVLARVGRPGHEIEIRMADIERDLLRTAGLDVTLFVIRAKLAEAAAGERGIKPVTEADVAEEIRIQLATIAPAAVPSQYPALIDQICATQKLSHAEFELAMRTNAYLRRISEQLMPKLNEDVLRQAFNYEYGEKVEVSAIAVSNLSEVAEVQKVLADADKNADKKAVFAEVAKAKSKDPKSASLGGELPPFSMAVDDIPKLFKDIAFSLKPGETSDPAQIGDMYYIIRCNGRVPPTDDKFESKREDVEKKLHARMISTAMGQYLVQLGEQTEATLKAIDPDLAVQWKARLAARDAANGPTTRHMELDAPPEKQDKAAETLRKMREMLAEKKKAEADAKGATRPSP